MVGGEISGKAHFSIVEKDTGQSFVGYALYAYAILFSLSK